MIQCGFLWLDRYLLQWIYFNGTMSSRRYQGAEYQFMKQTFMTTISGIGHLLFEYQFIKTHSWTQYWKLNLHKNALVSMWNKRAQKPNLKHYSLATTYKGKDNMEKDEKYFALLLAKAFFLRDANWSVCQLFWIFTVSKFWRCKKVRAIEISWSHPVFTLSLGLLSPPNLSFSGICKVRNFY